MPKRRPIRDKLLVVGLLVGFMVSLLSASSFLGVYSYRRLVRALSSRASELPRASRLAACVGRLRLAHARAVAAVDVGVWTESPVASDEAVALLESGEPEFQPPAVSSAEGAQDPPVIAADRVPRDLADQLPVNGSLLSQIAETGEALDAYCRELAAGELDERPFGDRSRERETARRIAVELKAIWSLARQAAAAPPSRDTAGGSPLIDERLVKLTAIGPSLDALAFPEPLVDRVGGARGLDQSLMRCITATMTIP